MPRPGARGHVPDPLPEARRLAADRFRHARRLWEDPDLAPWLRRALHSIGYDDGLIDVEEYGDDFDEEPEDGDFYEGNPFAWSADDIAELLGMRDTREALETLATVNNAEPHGMLPPRFVIELLADQALEERGQSIRPRLVHVTKSRAAAFVRQHHSKLPVANPRGLLLTFGVSIGARLAAVAWVNTPTGAFGPRPSCPVDGIVEITRIASDATVKGASSMLAARAIDVLPALGRRGVAGCLLVTYSLRSEGGTTYLALADKGMRPVGLVRGSKPHGARAGGDAAVSLSTEPKIVWQAGPAAAPADWSVLEGVASEKQLAAARKAFAGFEARARATTEARARKSAR